MRFVSTLIVITLVGLSSYISFSMSSSSNSTVIEIVAEIPCKLNTSRRPTTLTTTTTTEEPDIISLEELEKLLKELLMKTLGLGAKCNFTAEKQLDEIFPELPLYDLDELKLSLEETYYTLKKLYDEGHSFCNRKLFFTCTENGTCGCAHPVSLIAEDGECKLRRHKYCTLINEFTPSSILLREYPPLFKCQSGTSCTKIDLGLPVCYPDGQDNAPSVLARRRRR